ncbi:MAG: diguanylate cyclase [Planctomycetes bacterium]|nr:diguanylate cyclase [Planctomycetota bacterium]
MTEHLSPHILLVEDDMDTAELVRETLADHFNVDQLVHAPTVAEAMAMDLSAIDLVLSDMNLPDGHGLDLIDQLLARRRDLPIVMVTSESDLELATRAIQKGAFDYVVKAGDYLFTIPLIVEKNLAVYQIKAQNLQLHTELEQTLEELRIKNQQLEEAVHKLEDQASTDPLTNLANRRHIQITLERSFSESQRYGTDLAGIMIDLDGFKQLNDTLGHQQGDRLLQAMAKILQANCRRCDIAGRYGGDEFVLLLPHTDPSIARQVARRIKRQFVDSVRAMFPQHTNCDLSIGIACMSLSHPASADQLVALADGALYRAKQMGKARIIIHDWPDQDGPLPGDPSNTSSDAPTPSPMRH